MKFGIKKKYIYISDVWPNVGNIMYIKGAQTVRYTFDWSHLAIARSIIIDLNNDDDDDGGGGGAQPVGG